MSPTLPTAPQTQAPTGTLGNSSIARSYLEDALAPVADRLIELSNRISSYVPTETASARAILDHVLGSGGKRIRPALFFMSADVVGYRGEHLFPIAAVPELVHTASLLHDDVVDHSVLRRGRPTANSVFGDTASVLVGDVICSTASELMAATGNMEIVKTFARAIRLMSEGELLQLENLFRPTVAEATYLRILTCKTAILIEAACKTAGLLANSPASWVAALATFGHEVGVAFQLIDDALDYTGAADLIGKATLSDLPEGKLTLPVILLKDQVSEAERRRLATCVKGPIDAAIVAEVAAMVERHGTAEQTVERAHGHTRRAMAALHSLPASPARDSLEHLANKLLLRFV